MHPQSIRIDELPDLAPSPDEIAVDIKASEVLSLCHQGKVQGEAVLSMEVAAS